MYFWNIKKLQKDLVKWLKEKEQFKYFAVLSILGSIMMLIPSEWGKIDIIDWFMNLVLIIWIIFWTYKINWWDKWKDFIIKYLAISFVTMIRSIVIIIPILLIIWVIWVVISLVIWWEEVINNFENPESIENIIFMSCTKVYGCVEKIL